jgi:hypothetical protein
MREEYRASSLRRAASLAAAVLLCACASPSPPPAGAALQGYSVHVLTAPTLRSSRVEINGRTVDTTSVESIRSSVEAIVKSEGDLVVVREPGSTPADLRIDFTQEGRPLPETFYGFDIQWASKYFLADPRYRELVRSIKVDITRFPGGQERFRYDRSAKSSPADDLGMDKPYQFILTGEDIENYISLCRECGIVAEPELDLYIDDSRMWADMIDQIVNGLKYDLKYISAGNEPEVDIFSNWKYFGATNKDEALKSYLSRFLRYRDAVEKLKPGIRYAFTETGEWREPGLGENLDVLLGGLSGVRPGALSVHWYVCGEWEGLAKSSPSYPSIEHLVIHGNSLRNISYLAKVAATMKEKTRRYGQEDAKLFLGEWGVAWSGGKASASLQNSLAASIFNAEVQEYCKTLGFDSLEYFGLSDPSEWGSMWSPAVIAVAKDGSMTLRPPYYIYLMYKWLYGDRIIEISGGQTDDWSVYASKEKGKDCLMLINRTEKRSYQKTVELATSSGLHRVSIYIPPRSVTIVSFND